MILWKKQEDSGLQEAIQIISKMHKKVYDWKKTSKFRKLRFLTYSHRKFEKL